MRLNFNGTIRVVSLTVASVIVSLVPSQGAMAQNRYFTLNGGPVGAPTTWQDIGGSYGSLIDASIPSTGQLDAFDGALYTLINGSFVSNYTQNTNSGQVVFSSGASALGGALNINNQIWVSPTLPVARALFTIANTSATSQTFAFGMGTNLGSDGDTQVVSTSGGNATINSQDRWSITDNDSLTSGDPTVSTIVAGPGLLPNNFVLSLDYLEATYNLTLAPGASSNLLFYYAINPTATDAQSGISVFDSIDSMRSSGLFTGLSDAELASIDNYGIAGTPEPSALLGLVILGLEILVSRRKG
jgi:hypothetical protein